ncbi:hypothetical protein U0027_04465 [Agrobacterium tumefaciens]|uniref:hypothetical protein n=1 Tax=Agrobacterium tumefaciens TaxID=358 RepID=UPI000E0B70ED|nr:hypothetical protein [Agrobacterium tumefaciens]WQE40776.1 hypothetical protein U0027_04465 [Agrobacterium tumefaciens]
MPHNVEEDFLQAYYRLSAGAPTHPDLSAVVASGKKVRVNQSTVALEAGHSRTLISQRTKGYERICALLYPDEADRKQTPTATAGEAPSETKGEKLMRLREELRLTEAERDQFATRLAEAHAALELLNREIQSLRAEASRRDKNMRDFNFGLDDDRF